jgi:hypothetical protein
VVANAAGGYSSNESGAEKATATLWWLDWLDWLDEVSGFPRGEFSPDFGRLQGSKAEDVHAGWSFCPPSRLVEHDAGDGTCQSL